MTQNYPEPPRTDWGDLALLSEAEDPEDYRDVWGHVLDHENFQQLKKMIVVPGTYAEMPDSAPFDGAKYEAQDINVVFCWEEAAGEWTPMNTGTAAEPVPGTTQVESLAAEELNTEVHPAPEDGLEGITDAVPSDATTVEINLQGGTYAGDGVEFTDTEFPNLESLKIVGEGYGTLLTSGSGHSGALLTVENIDHVIVRDIRVEGADAENIQFSGNEDVLLTGFWSLNAGQNTESGDGVDLDGVTDAQIRNGWTQNNSGSGVHISYSDTHGSCRRAIVDGIVSINDRSHADALDLAAIDIRRSTECQIRNCYAVDSGVHAFGVSGTNDNPVEHALLRDNYAINPTENGFDFGFRVDDVRVLDNYVEEATVGVFVSAAATGTTIRGTDFGPNVSTRYGDASDEAKIDEWTVVRVGLSSSQSVEPNTVTHIAFDTIADGNLQGFDTDTNEFVVPHEGTYHVELAYAYTSGLDDQSQVLARLELNGATAANSYVTQSGTEEVSGKVSQTFDGLSAADTISAHTRHDSGSSNTISRFGNNTYLTITRVE